MFYFIGIYFDFNCVPCPKSIRVTRTRAKLTPECLRILLESGTKSPDYQQRIKATTKRSQPTFSLRFLITHTQSTFILAITVAMAIIAVLQSVFANLAPFHLLSFSALFGSQLYQTFVVTKVAFNTLPRPAYTKFQKTIFPVYFHGQSLLLILTAVTFPPHGPLSLIQQKSDWIPFAVSGVASALNFFIYGPRTRQLMLDRAQQGSLTIQVIATQALTEYRDRGRESNWLGWAQRRNGTSEEEVFESPCHVHSSKSDINRGSPLVHLEVGLSPSILSIDAAS